MKDTGPQLTPLGFPFLYLSMKVLSRGVELYSLVNRMAVSPTARVIMSNPVNAVVYLFEIGVVAFVVLVAPFRLSSALDDLTERLIETRCNSPKLHPQVQAVESMLKHANCGKGWGIKISRGVVLNKELLQALCIRAALLATAAAAFLDSQMGFASALGKENAMEADLFSLHAEVSSIRGMLNNITMPVREHK